MTNIKLLITQLLNQTVNQWKVIQAVVILMLVMLMAILTEVLFVKQKNCLSVLAAILQYDSDPVVGWEIIISVLSSQLVSIVPVHISCTFNRSLFVRVCKPLMPVMEKKEMYPFCSQQLLKMV